MPAKLSDDCSRFGLLIMRDCYLMIDGKQTFVPARTILIDREACRKKRGGRTSWVIIHECIHFILHRPFFEAQRLYNEELSCLCCGTEAGFEKDNSLYWLEWQADHLPPHLMIPSFVAPGYISEEQMKLRRRFPEADEETIQGKTIPIIADMFYASKQCTEIRLKELGFPSQPHGFTETRDYTASMKPESRVAEPSAPYGARYTVSVSDLLTDGGIDRNLRKALESGRYIYADSHFCVNSPEYIYSEADGSLHMTAYALSHESECCLPFWTRKRYGYSPDAFNKNEVTGTVIVCGSEGKVRKKTPEEVYQEINGVIEGLPASVGGTLKKHMERLDVTVEGLEEFSHVSQTAIKDIRANRCGSMEMGFFIAICIGLKLEPAYSLDLIRKTRYQFDASPESTIYLILITSMYLAGIDACNDFLMDNGFKPLTRKARNGDF